MAFPLNAIYPVRNILQTVCSMLRPDIVIYNPETVVLELTVPFDERMSKLNKGKKTNMRS